MGLDAGGQPLEVRGGGAQEVQGCKSEAAHSLQPAGGKWELQRLQATGWRLGVASRGLAHGKHERLGLQVGAIGPLQSKGCRSAHAKDKVNMNMAPCLHCVPITAAKGWVWTCHPDPQRRARNNRPHITGRLQIVP